MKPKLLIICDSHGAGYGTTGFAETIRQQLDESWEIDIRAFGGIPVTIILEKLKSNPLKQYDVAIVQTGNPDVHPRMPIKPLRWFRSRGLSFMRDSLFSVPPKFSVRYFLRFPFFLIRLALMRFHQEFIVEVDTLISATDSLIGLVRNVSAETIVFPIFHVKPSVYTDSHNKRAELLNEHLSGTVPDCLITDKICSAETYKNYYNRDGFHFVKEYHDLLADYLVKEIADSTDSFSMRVNSMRAKAGEEVCAV